MSKSSTSPKMYALQRLINLNWKPSPPVVIRPLHSTKLHWYCNRKTAFEWSIRKVRGNVGKYVEFHSLKVIPLQNNNDVNFFLSVQKPGVSVSGQ